MKQIKTLLKRGEQAKARIAKERDKLRNIIAELEEIAEGMDDAEDNIGAGLRNLNDAADRMSEYL